MVSFRDVVERIVRELKPYKDQKLMLDFRGIEVISRSAADELLNVKARFLYLEFINLNSELAVFLRTVAASKAYPEKFVTFKPQKVTLSSVFI